MIINKQTSHSLEINLCNMGPHYSYYTWDFTFLIGSTELIEKGHICSVYVSIDLTAIFLLLHRVNMFNNSKGWVDAAGGIKT